ncbi:hypothetical protein S100390_v1c00160 [Spiroplasma sp. NBRC 100390]|uniref:hypothetical protein n=1 Tax=unclassified Spiroplasma TaxID=2637901 RepID=UPI0008928A27|nr:MULTISPECIES: hypothetical protein [unclassified Spiroplasma]AOX43359.1 hypothetical protein STU14_v1c00160 [Spiroplasma sp. TU-14]APE12829.1 hypothetical protein S100390_v1c00160 [Spiroplasma sp. NBRC 100390]
MRLYQDYVNEKMIWNNDVPYSSNIGSYAFYVASFLIITGVTLLINSKSMFKYNNHKNQNFNQVNYFFNIIFIVVFCLLNASVFFTRIKFESATFLLHTYFWYFFIPTWILWITAILTKNNFFFLITKTILLIILFLILTPWTFLVSFKTINYLLNFILFNVLTNILRSILVLCFMLVVLLMVKLCFLNLLQKVITKISANKMEKTIFCLLKMQQATAKTLATTYAMDFFLIYLNSLINDKNSKVNLNDEDNLNEKCELLLTQNDNSIKETKIIINGWKLTLRN